MKNKQKYSSVIETKIEKIFTKSLPTFEDVQKSLDSTILSASGWRRVFAESQNEQDKTTNISSADAVLAAMMSKSFSDFIIQKSKKEVPTVVLGTDTRPTGALIADIMIRVLISNGIDVKYLGISAAPEIMAYSYQTDGFVYISASHNPIGHNGVKFGTNNGGVLASKDATILADNFRKLCSHKDCIEQAKNFCLLQNNAKIYKIYSKSSKFKEKALNAYTSFTAQVVSDKADKKQQKAFFRFLKKNSKITPITVVADMNGSARTVSIDNDFLTRFGIKYHAINNKPGDIVHEIIPEPENLIFCADEITNIFNSSNSDIKNKETFLGYMPDCDGDRGNIVYWNKNIQKAEVLKAQEVFALSVLAELSFSIYQNKKDDFPLSENIQDKKTIGIAQKLAVVVNDPTSMRIEEIARCFGADVFRAEVGEANVVNLAREKRKQGFVLRILGEGSNGGNITHPAAVRDPLNTLFALLKLLLIKDTPKKKGLFHDWCIRSNQEDKFKENFSLCDIIATLPQYATTGVSEKRAIAAVLQKEHTKLKAAYQKIFEEEWNIKKTELKQKYGFYSFEPICNNGTTETRNISDYSVSKTGGLKILFKGSNGENLAFLWMRGSGTEPVFRIMCDVKGTSKTEEELLEWHTKMILQADEFSLKQ